MAIHLPMLEQTPTPLTSPGPPLLPTPSPVLILLSTLFPNWPDEPTPFLVTLEPPLSFLQGNDIIMTLHWLNGTGEGVTNEVLLEWALEMLHSLEYWRWLWSLEPAITPSSSPTPNLPPPPWYDASNANPPSMSTLSALSMFAPSVKEWCLVTPNAPASCAPAPFAENSVTWAPLAQPQLQLTALLFLPEWVTLDNLELLSQGYEGGNVMVWETPISFSLFMTTDCTLLSHFSFNDFVTLAFPDLARDLDLHYNFPI